MTLPSERIADHLAGRPIMVVGRAGICLLYTSDAADE